jgi:hypothetical protein
MRNISSMFHIFESISSICREINVF